MVDHYEMRQAYLRALEFQKNIETIEEELESIQDNPDDQLQPA